MLSERFEMFSERTGTRQMKRKLLDTLKVFLILLGTETALFILMIFFIMTDEPVLPIGKGIYSAFKYGAGFPLVLVNDDFPFFIDSHNPPKGFFLLTILNLVIQTGLIMGLLKLFKRFFKK